MATITPHLWFDREAREAAELYTSLVPDSRVTRSSTLRDTPSGDAELVSFELGGQPFMAISAGPMFKFNPAVSFQLRFATAMEVDAAWARLAHGGRVRMALGSYPFSPRYGWVADKYGLEWQLMQAPEPLQRVTPALMFAGAMYGRCEEAIGFYASVFKSPAPQVLARYGAGQAPDREGAVQYAAFALRGLQLGAMESARVQDAAFNEAISFMVPCVDQAEIDYFWNALAADPQAGQCGWLKDKYGLSWQIVPTMMNQMMASGEPERIARVTQAFLKMKKFDVAALQRAFDGA